MLDVVVLILRVTEEKYCCDESSRHIKTECGQGVCCHAEDEVSSRSHVQSDGIVDDVVKGVGNIELCKRGECLNMPEVKVRAD